MFGTLGMLFIFHRRQRDKEREKRIQYWREQVRVLLSLGVNAGYSFIYSIPSMKTLGRCAKPPRRPSTRDMEMAL